MLNNKDNNEKFKTKSLTNCRFVWRLTVFKGILDMQCGFAITKEQ